MRPLRMKFFTMRSSRRVICDYGESSARRSTLDALAREALECPHFAVDGYAEGLENLREPFCGSPGLMKRSAAAASTPVVVILGHTL